MPRAVICVEDVSWRYADARSDALSGISLAVGAGEFLAVMGADGAGKSTLCRLMNGLVPHSIPGALSGRVTVGGIDTAASSVARLSSIAGMAFADAPFLADTAFDEVAFALENMMIPAPEIEVRTRRALAAAGLSGLAGRHPAELSGGQRQRLSIAAAIAMANGVLVLDEPCSALDPEGALDVLSFVADLRRSEGLAVVMATASPEEAAAFADRVCVLAEGRVIALAPPREVFADPRLPPRAGIPAPDVCAFAFGMAARGCPLPALPLTVEEAAGMVSGDSAVVSEPRVPSPAPDCGHNGNPLISAENLTFSYAPGRRPALDGTSFAVGAGEFVAILGRNGSGKTTLLKCLAGLLRPAGGAVRVMGKDSAGMGVAEIAREVGFVMQDCDSQLFEQTVWDEVAFALRARRMAKGEIAARVGEALESLGLQDKRNEFPLALRRPDRMKTVFAAVVAMGARVLLLDEPLVGHDERGSRAVMDSLAALNAGGRTVVMVTHDVRAAALNALRLAVMKEGRIVLDAPPADVLACENLLASESLLATAGIPLPPIPRLALRLGFGAGIVAPEELAAAVAGNR